MKTQLHRHAALGLTLAVLPFVSGCEADHDGSKPGLLTTALAETVNQSVASTNTVALLPTPALPPTVESPSQGEAAAPELNTAKPSPAGEPALPPSINQYSPLGEVVKLAQSGVDASVMLTYITNSGSTFGLGADEIVYLNDLGMPSEVITTIMEHDKAMKQFWADQTQSRQVAAPTPAPETVSAEPAAAAPTYVNPPVAEAVPAEQQPVNVTYNYFYDSLSPYGSWVNVEGYGTCWQPSVVVLNSGWQPYRDGGRWMYTDAGWYWYSDYTWGWAPFHYGRWLSHPRWGWCWYPGYTWGPAWVTWRYNDGYCGWAPLPPAAHYSAGFGFTYYGSSVGVGFGFGLGYDCYTFVPWNRFCNYRPATYHAPRHHSKDIYHNSTVVNNVINGNNNTIINGGVPVERVTAATKSDIQKVALRDMSGTATRGGRRERLDGDGRTLVVHRPQAPQNSFSPASASSGGSRQGSGGRGTRPAITQTRQTSGSQGEKALEPKPTATRPTQGQDVSPASGRTSLAVEKPLSRPATTAAQTRESVTTPELPATTSTASPRAKTIDVPATRPTRSGPAENSAASSTHNSERSGTVSPLILRGSERVSEPTSRPTVPQASSPSAREQGAAPSSSLVVIGRRDSASSQRQGIIPATQPETRATESMRPDSRSSTVNAASERQGYSRPSAPQREFSQPQISSPVTRSVQPENNSRSTFSAPAQRSSIPASSVTPRPSAPASNPQISRPAPAPSVSAPRSAPAPTPAPASRPAPSPPSNSRPSSRNN